MFVVSLRSSYASERARENVAEVAHERREGANKRFVLTRKISHLIRMNMRKAGVRKRPYVLRAYAETQLITAESKGKISHSYLQFIAGHKGDIEARYSTNKGRLPPEMIEDMRTGTRAASPISAPSRSPWSNRWLDKSITQFPSFTSRLTS